MKLIKHKQYIWKKIICLCLISSMILPMMPMTDIAAEKSVEDKGIIVSLGDSFSSGEGIEPYYGQENEKGEELPISEKVKNPDWLAHRSTKSWPSQLTLPSVQGEMSKHRNENWFFVAASGATTQNIKYNFKKEYDKSWGVEGEYNLDPQLDVFDEIDKGEVDYVTLTLGGNDAGFTDILEICVMYGKCSFLHPNMLADKINNVIKDFYASGGIHDKLYDAYHDIADKAGEQAHIFVVGYPKLFSSYIRMISEKEVGLVNDAVIWFNNAIEILVEECDDEINISFVSVIDAFEGHGAGSNEPYINEIQYFTQKSENLEWSPTSSASMHPNKKGAAAYARCVQTEINKYEYINCKRQFELSVYDRNHNLYDNYDIEIEGRRYLVPLGLFTLKYSDFISVDSTDPVDISLPSGKFTIKVIDRENKERIVCQEVSTKNPFAKIDRLTFNTEFGIAESDADTEQNSYGNLMDPDANTSAKEEMNLSDERNVVLTLDTSGSMDGTPLDETKKAADKFVNTVLNEDASIGLVTYDSSSEVLSSFSNNSSALRNIVSEIYSSGGTNMESGLLDAQLMLQGTNAKKKIIVLMSDGEPNEGRIGEELIAYADEIKKSGITIYTLGFFEDLSDKSNAQYLMEQIASDGCHYEVANAEDLVFFFEDMADQINGQKYIYVRIACPVDVAVTYNGETLDSDENNLNDRTSFGTLTFEENRDDSDTSDSSDTGNKDDRVKILRLKDGVDYDIKINGTGYGTMNYTIGFMDDDGEYSDLRKFQNIKITRNTAIDTVASNVDDTTLNIDEDGDGKYDLKLRAEANGYGQEVSLINWIYYVMIGMGVFILIDIVLIIIYVKRRNKRN